MKILKHTKKLWLRASFSLIVPIVAFIATALACIITMLVLSLSNSQAQNAEFTLEGQHVAAALSGPLVNYDRAGLEKTTTLLAPQGALIIGIDGKQAHNSLPQQQQYSTHRFPILLNNRLVGELHLVVPKVAAATSPLSWFIFVLLLCSMTAAIVARVATKWASDYVDALSIGVQRLTPKNADALLDRPVFAAEFRRLNVSLVRTMRRTMREITALRKQALVDERTGLLNDKALDIQLNLCLENVTFDNPGALISFEISMLSDHLERQYVTLPETAFKEAAVRMRGFIERSLAKRGLPRDTWALATLPGDLFAMVIMSDGAKEELSTIIRDLQMEMHHPLKADGQSFTVRIVGSIIRLPEDGDSITQIRQRSRATITDLKAQGKTGFAFYSPRLERQRDARINLESEMREAVEKDRFVPLFQPKVDLSTGRICGAEALARWQLENGRLVAPSVFIDLAEQTGMINAIGEQIMRKSCLEAAQWTQRGHRLNLAVNVSPRQFEEDQLGQMILESLARSGLSPRHLEIEITESLAIKQHNKVRSVLDPLKKMGIKLAVDDFGTGHSNLAVLTKIDFDVFKIDRQFVSGTPGDPQANAIVEMILSMANTLNMQIVGEGIETPGQARFLQQRGCHVGQGFLYSQPVTAAAFRKMLEEQPFVRKKLRA